MPFFNQNKSLSAVLLTALLLHIPTVAASEPVPLAGTKPLDSPLEAAALVAEIDRFLSAQTERTVAERETRWEGRLSDPQRATEEIPRLRQRLRTIIGVGDERVASPTLHPKLLIDHWGLVDGDIVMVRNGVKVFETADGVPVYANMLEVADPPDQVGYVILIPDADQSPAELIGLLGNLPRQQQFARRLAQAGYRVLIPQLVNRSDEYSVVAQRKTNQPHREFIYRQAFELGRHIIGYEVQAVLAMVDSLKDPLTNIDAELPVIVAGYGEGGLIALHAAACDERIEACAVSGYFGPREALWQEPIYRNTWDRLTEFGDAELAALIAPRKLIIEAAAAPDVAGPPPVREGRSGAAPGRITTPTLAAVEAEVTRTRRWYEKLNAGTAENVQLIVSTDADGEAGAGSYFSDPWQQAVVHLLAPAVDLPPPPEGDFQPIFKASKDSETHARDTHRDQFQQWVHYTQSLLRQAEAARREYWSDADSSSIARWEETTAPYRQKFYDEAIGRFELELLPPAARTRQVFDEPAYRGYEVELDVFPGLTAQGLLLIPKDISEGEQRPVVVCQHGLEGRPHDLADPTVNNAYYEQYGCRLAERGFIVFAPQNPYIGQDAFRVLQRKANPLGKSLFSIIVPQHQAIVNWLARRPEVDPQRIAFYGLSYGGKTAMRVPPLVDGYCLSICSADFNEWIWKNASATSPYSYLATGEYEIFEFNLGGTFNYAEMAGLIAPRPFMVERGHFDGVAPDEQVAYEYAKVRRLYAVLGIPERTEIEFFAGPHKIHGVGTFEFLHRHLNWRRPE